MEFEVGYIDPDDGEVRRLFADAFGVAFERVPAVRSFPSYKGQRNYPGLYWSASWGGHVGVESWLERDEVMAMDFDEYYPDGEQVPQHRRHADPVSG
ncbi:hypothetical protein ACIG87_00375 [Micromonospora sp. NPDC051925]|uniref:hypothetical protein n=1 Tax=Micromonospora sp. NPDC051925 TaxID=3364288 RepID=UPI0037C7E3CA